MQKDSLLIEIRIIVRHRDIFAASVLQVMSRRKSLHPLLLPKKENLEKEHRSTPSPQGSSRQHSSPQGCYYPR